VIAVSGGNFAQAVAYAGARLGIDTKICMPSYTPQNYLNATRAYGADIELLPDIASAFALAEQYRQHGRAYLHPYDDRDIMAGAGTVGLEIFEDVPDVTDVFVSVGGGGLMTGTVTALKALQPEVRAWSVETEGADALGQALAAGKPVPITPTSLARTLGAPIVSADALATAQQHVEQHLIVSDAEAYHALRVLLERAKLLTELAAACTLAAAERVRAHFTPDSHVVLILCGGNVSLDDVVEYHRRFEEP
jgi:threonine dehydratase